ncbi:DUF3515 domain-containing protein [Corynebacterium riegelii]|uniref:DUF3515 domain-containing protein n=1 Tax=Corynebacterium riegelii TaxID=156976 RepID=UPI0023F62416|nr:DUF3515 domain-containing protein [Corynebacterium riegelii]
MSSTLHNANQINRKAVYAILALAVGLVLAVLIGARVVFTQAAQQPVTLPQLPSPEADSAECAQFMDTLPEKVAGFKRANLAEPVPAGATAWQRSSTERVTLRCGVDMPMQYNVYSEPEEAHGAKWLRVDDPATTLATWFTVDRSPVVAVTADTAQVRRSPIADIDASTLPQADIAPAPAPLSALEAVATDVCDGLLENAPKEIAEGFSLISDPATPSTLTWTKPGAEPVVLRCGVTPPENYAPGASLTQVNEVPWFQDVVDGMDVFYALGRKTDLAASMPITGSNEIITNLSGLIAREVPAAPQAQ